MAREFKSANLYEIQDIVSTYPFSRRITEVHLHHTWRPRQTDYRGLATIEGMWRFHTQTNKWSDIGQHVTIAPNGAIWLCRNFNWAPASASGFNGNSFAGPFMIEMIGNFDINEENIACDQIQATLSVIKAVQNRFNLEAHQLRFHNEMSPKSCPGTGVDKNEWIEQINAFTLAAQNSRGASIPFPTRATRAYELMRGMNPDATQTDDMSASEHDGNAESESSATDTRVFSARETELSIDVLETLSAHAVNLERGQLSASGRLETTTRDIDRLFDELLPQEISRARSEGRKAQLLFYAHGGLVSEKNALLSAHKQLPFWRANGVYPVFFIWETGFAETVRQLVNEAANRTRPPTRGPVQWLSDNITDPLIEQVARTAGGRLIWGGMKSSAELASSAEHGAAYVAQKTAELISSSADHVDVHIVGHSAGSIFHSHFMPLLVKQAVPVKTAHFLAPAVRNDLFHQNVVPLLGKGIGSLTLFTMNKLREKADTVASIYQKSLLYLVSRAFEDSNETDILGLEESLRKDMAARQLFGLQGQPSGLAEVIWSPTHDSLSGNGSTALTHGAFDDDAATMEGVLRRVRDLRNGETIEPFPAQASRGQENFWNAQFDWPENLEYLAATHASPGENIPALNDMNTAQPTDDPVVAETAIKPASDKKDKKKLKKKKKKKDKAEAKEKRMENSDDFSKDAQKAGKNGTLPDKQSNQSSAVNTLDGRRLALCIGIDEYVGMPLAGCVADAMLWKKTLTTLGFEVKLLTNQQATADRIRRSVSKLVASSRAGDQLVLQFAGHGTQFKDTDGDEILGKTPAMDECLCAVDCGVSDDGLVIDDELRHIIETLPESVSMTCFFDCCHSGTITRAAFRMAGKPSGADVRPRFMPPNKVMKKAYENRMKKTRKIASRAPAIQKDVLFSACRSSELAYESDGQGDFTRHATAVISAGTEGLKNADFLARILQSFGSNPRQNPEIHCDFSARDRSFMSLGNQYKPDPSSGQKKPIPESA